MTVAEPKRILFLSHSASRTGAPLLLRDIAAQLDRGRYEPHFILGEDGPLHGDFAAMGPTIVDPFYPEGVKYWREVKHARRRWSLLQSIFPDLVYCNTIHPAKWLPYAKMQSIPTLMHVHELSYGFATLGPLEHYLIRELSDRIIAVSESVRDYLVHRRGVKPEKISVVHAGIRVAEFAPRQGDPALRRALGLENSVVAGIVGRITPMKGSDMLPVLYDVVRHSAPDLNIKFLVVASTDDREAWELFMTGLRNRSLENHIVVVPDVPNPADYYALMDMFVSVAREDPFPLVVLEAMASGLPAVSFRVGGIPEAVNEQCGILIEPFDLNLMAEGIVRLAREGSVRRSMGEQGRSRALELFDLGKNVSKISGVIDAALARRRS